MPCEVIEAAAVCKTEAERVARNLDLTGACARTWAAGAIFAPGAVIRPALKSEGGRRGATGYEYITSGGGQSGEVEPKWPTTPSATVSDGSITWTCQALSNASLERIIAASASVVWIAPAGVTLSDPSLRNTSGVQQVGTFVAGMPTNDDENIVVARVTFSDGETRDFGFTVGAHELEAA